MFSFLSLLFINFGFADPLIRLSVHPSCDSCKRETKTKHVTVQDARTQNTSEPSGDARVAASRFERTYGTSARVE